MNESVLTLFHDDFNDTSLNSSWWKLPKWSDGASFLGRTQLRVQEEHSLPEVNNGIVSLRLDTFNPTGLAFLGTEIITTQKFDVNTGLAFEASVRVNNPIVRGLVASLFSYEGTGESIHDELTFEILTNDIDNATKGMAPNRILTNAYSDMPLGPGDFEYVNVPGNKSLKEFNLLRVELYQDRVDWFINGEKVRTETQTVPDEPMDIRLNFWAPGQEWNDAYDASTFPVASSANNQTYFYEIDFVNVERIGGDDYIASYADLIQAFGYDLQAAEAHYKDFGSLEGRAVDIFPEAEYLASHDDLINAFGYDLEAVTKHYINHGYYEGRSRDSFAEDIYLASHGDLINAFGYDLEASTAHYISYGASEQRATDLFNPSSYLGAYQDLQAAFGNNLELATRHYIEYGYVEGRSW